MKDAEVVQSRYLYYVVTKAKNMSDVLENCPWVTYKFRIILHGDIKSVLGLRSFFRDHSELCNQGY